MSLISGKSIYHLGKLFTRHLSLSFSRSYSGLQYESPDEMVDRTTVEVGSENPDMHPLSLTGYGIGCFRFAKITIRESVAILDQAVFKWNITDPKDITAASFAMFYMAYPKLELVVVGTGNDYHPLDPEVIAELGKRGLKVEVQDTIHACGTYNFIKMDRPQQIGAALIPITKIAPASKKMLHRGSKTMIK